MVAACDGYYFNNFCIFFAIFLFHTELLKLIWSIKFRQNSAHISIACLLSCLFNLPILNIRVEMMGGNSYCLMVVMHRWTESSSDLSSRRSCMNLHSFYISAISFITDQTSSIFLIRMFIFGFAFNIWLCVSNKYSIITSIDFLHIQYLLSNMSSDSAATILISSLDWQC